jgi:hypothetical protein
MTGSSKIHGPKFAVLGAPFSRRQLLAGMEAGAKP